MDASYIKPFMESTKAVFSTMFMMEVAFGRPHSVESAARFDVSGIVGMSGDVAGSIVVGLPLDVATSIVARLFGAELAAASDDFSDAIGELVNMISGAAKARFIDRNVSISCPSVVVGPGHTVRRPRYTQTVSIPCTTSFGAFSIDIAIRPAAVSRTAA